MAIETTTIDVQLDGQTLTHALSVHRDPVSDRLLVILPGRAYLVSHPALHYLRLAALDAGWDVLPVQYGFQVLPALAAGMGDLAAECRKALELALARGYRRVCLAGKSLGTPVAVTLAHECAANGYDASLILLTPVGSAVEDAGALATLAVIGTADPFYSQAAVESERRASVTWRVLEGLNHGLEAVGWRESLAALGEVTQFCAAFLQRAGG